MAHLVKPQTTNQRAQEGQSFQECIVITCFFIVALEQHIIEGGASPVAQWVKKSACKAGDIVDTGLIPGSGRSPGENGNPLQYFSLESPMDRGAWCATVHGVTKSWT